MQAIEHSLIFNHYQFIIDDKKVVDFSVHCHKQTVRLGDIYLAEIEKCDGQFCFLSIGQTEKLFIRQKNIKSTLNDIDIKTGNRLYVQVNATQRVDKWARATGNINLNSDHLVLTTDCSGLFISKKISNQNVLSTIKMALEPLINRQFCIVVRTAAGALTKEQLIGEAKHLIKQFEALIVPQTQKDYQPLRHRDKAGLFECYHDKITSYHANKRGQLNASFQKSVALYQQLDLLAWLKDNQRQTVVLTSGVELTIDQLEAMTVIDIDSAGFTNRLPAEDFNYAVNWAALSVLPTELAKRKISGTVIVDCLMMQKQTQKELLKQVKALFKSAHMIVKGMSSSGLLELSITHSTPSVKQCFYNRVNQIKAEVLIDYWLDYMIYYAKCNQKQQFYFTVSRDIYYKMEEVQQSIKDLLRVHNIKLSLQLCDVADGIMQPIRHAADTNAEKSPKIIDLVPFV